MNITSRTVRFAAACFVLTLAACGGGGDDGGGGGTPAAGTVVGAAGGTVVGPNGAKVEIPAGALATATTISIEQTSAGAPALPGGFTASGQTFAFTPHGTTFDAPVTITLPFAPALVPAGSRPTLYKTNAQNQWEQVAGVSVGANTVSAQVTGFSFGTAGVERLPPQRQWTFFNDKTGETLSHNDFDRPPWQKVEDSLQFGTSVFDLDIEDNDKKITLEVFSSTDGVTFWASAEDQGFANLIQTQGFIKIAEPATLQFVISAATLQAADFNVRVPSPNECPRGLELSVCHPLSALIEFSAMAFGSDSQLLRDPNGKPLLARSSSARLEGYVGVWDFHTQRDPMFAETLAEYAEAWSRVNFLFTTDAAGNPKAKLVNDIVIDVDLSSLTVGTKFYVQSYVHAAAFNERGRESAIAAYVRDPARTGGATVNATGLQLTNDTAPPPPGASLTAPVPCTAGPNPAAGVLQFSAANFKMLEEPFGGNRGVQVTRTQGSTGAVSATLRTGGGTAVPGVHYTPKSVTVNFADGETAPRSVALEIFDNGAVEDDRTVNLTLTEPGGCATLGAQASSVLTIFDDERSPPPPPPSGLDLSFGGGDGKATLEGFGGDRSAMALQADGKIVMVGGSFSDFILARFNTDGSPDNDFGVGGGKVVTDMGGGNRLEEATAVAIQPDGRIVVAGYTAVPHTPPAPRLPETFAIARYNSNGSLDTSFGTGGRVSGGVNGRAFAIAIQPDGKIVLAGDFTFDSTSGSDFSDFTVARFNADGSLDLSFGITASGQVATDIGLHANSARNIVLQPNGAIVVSGKPVGSSADVLHTDMARYDRNGNLDASFGVGGKLTLAGRLVGEGLALQSDGKFVLVGSVNVGSGATASTDFALMRLNTDGSPDTTFGTAGTVTTAISNERDAALAVALQADGRIVVAGHTSNINANFAVARYNTNGALDTSFGNGTGVLTVDFFRFTDSAESVLVQPDGKIVLGGVVEDKVDGYGLARINP
jgi:uncharacterized delta-60 repeat protein